MDEKIIDRAAAAVTVAAPAWEMYLKDVNAVLTAVSLALGIAFLIWRWANAVRREGHR